MGSIQQPIDIQCISKARPLEPDSIYQSLRTGTLPTMLLYDEIGLQLFEKITYNPHYYLTGSEIGILEKHADDIARNMVGSDIIELGSGALRKTSLLLKAVDRLGVDVDYYALDLDRCELERSLSDLTNTQLFSNIRLHGLHADYNDIHAFLRDRNRRVTILWMGSSIGNFDRDDAAIFVQSIKQSLKPGDCMLIGVDHRNNPELIQTAYNDPQGDSERFEKNALAHANRILGQEAFRDEDWTYEGRYHKVEGYHQVNFVPKCSVDVGPVHIERGSRIRLERSYKYSRAEMAELLERSELAQNGNWTDGLYSLYLATVPIAFSPSSPEMLQSVPSLQEWEALWSIWDTITLNMIPPEMLLQKPIDLRNPCIFYIGHIPTFLDIHLARATRAPFINSSYTQIFERGIDPDVDDPTRCHAHSALPKEWPDLQELIEFRDAVRQRLRKVYKDVPSRTRRLDRALFTAFEHEAMHAETLLYMLLQSPSTLPPPGIQPATDSANEIEHLNWLKFESQSLTIGMNDPEQSDSGGAFGWDNEKPRRAVEVPAFEIASRPITNGDYARYLSQTTDTGKKWRHPQSWTPDCRVKTLFGSVSMSKAVNWPVAASYDELSAYARWAGARLPSYGELRRLYDDASTIDPAYNDVHGKIVNFSRWNPAAVTDSSQAQTYLGVWEWTSTVFDRTPGFITSEIYPGYSEDFFDGKHNIVIGGSWATLSRIAARRSFVNWYQRNYEYAWVGARLAR